MSKRKRVRVPALVIDSGERSSVYDTLDRATTSSRRGGAICSLASLDRARRKVALKDSPLAINLRMKSVVRFCFQTQGRLVRSLADVVAARNLFGKKKRAREIHNRGVLGLSGALHSAPDNHVRGKTQL